MPTISPAKIVSQHSYRVAGKLQVTEHFFDVPKDYNHPSSGTLRIFARSVRKHDLGIVKDASPEKDQLPWMCWLQGGPGMECRAPQQYPWTHPVLDRGYQMLYLDQRGVGLSSPVTASTLQMRGDTDVQAKYLKLYRADSIVKDCEAIRQALTADYPEEKKRWSIMGQSFGGFCSLTYLSFHPEGLRESFIFGGLAPISVRDPDEVYRRLYKQVIRRNEAYYDKFPEDVARVKTVMKYLSRFGDGKIRLPSEGTLTRRRFQQMGILFGAHGGLDMVHDIVLRAANDIGSFGHLTRGTLTAIDHSVGYDEHLIYSILHEPIYCQGQAPKWSAHRILSEYEQAFSLDKDEGQPIFLTGEMIYPWMFEDYSELRKVQDAAEKVAADDNWSPLYDAEQLSRNEVPVYAAAYVEDMYVDFDMSMETARKVKGCKVFTTNVMFHDAIRSKMEEVVKQAFALRDDVVD
ncbi:hypothetical protein BAUCODRAFT_63307 [Baudoinia panamericana UAMH 10762]|uniref:AB hydrolase-1 domain-containing protein n=1 Tax=Baudoinia panamericana (strain UAMH 10762) TaxID=717646 RepID=M2NLS2_BAUPA|nr:uncharacterized protein BAUCODRAFT_63307 [Baudoinia panamericana UAMH 10762]EMD00106.1 hypothetical protein BAUCODRAFT_63307 [Baudoinia panamericana UAMH 10762]